MAMEKEKRTPKKKARKSLKQKKGKTEREALGVEVIRL